MYGRRHLFHLVNPSPWPILSSFSALYLLSGIAYYMHNVVFGGTTLVVGLCCTIYCIYFWSSDVIEEATNSGYHTQVVTIGLKLGFLLFLVSEIMLFFGFFWAFFHAGLSPSIETGSIFPPEGIIVIPVLEFPLFNTIVLIVSGISVTWAHHSISLNNFRESIDALLITIFLGYLFISLQMFEYYESFFEFSDSIYACSFYMLTGLHGFHVFVGATLLFICFLRLLKRHMYHNSSKFLILAIWYWHLIDIIWIILFVVVYCWGSW